MLFRSRRDGLKEETWTAGITDCVPPAAPAAPTFSSISCNSLTVNWASSSGATLYDVYRIAGGCSGTSPLLVGNGISGTSFNDSGLTPLSQYSYYIIARNATCQRYACGACTTATTTSCSAPPLRVPYSQTPTNITTANHGTNGTVTWDVADCPSTNYHIIYGKGENLAAWTVDGGKCTIGTSGSYPWTGIPDPSNYASKFLWFLVVGDNGSATEGSWGLTYPDGAEEGGANCSNACGMTTKSTSATCEMP